MARIRSIRPEFWEDETVGQLSRDARLLYIATWNCADDCGVLRWSGSYLKAAAFMYDHDLQVNEVEKLMLELVDNGFVQTYEAGKAGQRFGWIQTFTEYQKPNRPQPSKLPLPPGLSVQIAQEITPVVESRVGESSGEYASDNYPEEFTEFWEMYPHKVAKPQAFKAFTKALKLTSLESLLAGVERWLPYWATKDRQYVPHASTWLNRHGWHDEPPPTVRAPGDRNRDALFEAFSDLGGTDAGSGRGEDSRRDAIDVAGARVDSGSDQVVAG